MKSAPFFRHAVGIKLTVRVPYNILKMAVIPVYQANPAHIQEPGFTVQVFRKIRMFIRADMVVGNIGKHPIIKTNAIYPVHL